MDQRSLFINNNHNQNNNHSLNGIGHDSHSIIPTLQRLWKNEKFSKDLLQYEDSFFSHLFTEVEAREAEIKQKTFSKEETDLMELDLQRVKFIIKEYHRIRLCKIEKYLLYILKNDLSSLLSENEIKFVVDLINMKAVYFNEGLKKLNPLVNSFKPFNDKTKTLADKMTYISDEMIVAPDKKSYIIVQANEDQIMELKMREVYDDAEVDTIIMKEGDIEAVPYTLIHKELKDNTVKLI